MRCSRFIAVLIFTALLTVPFAHEAQAGQKLGDVFTNVLLSWNGIAGFLAMVSYISGIFLAVHSIFKFKDHVNNPHQTKISDGVKRMLAGGMFLSLPYMCAVLQHSILGSATNNPQNTGFTNAAVADSLDGMVATFIANIAGPAEGLLTGFSYLFGLALLMVGISRLTKKMEEGPRGPAGAGTFMTFIAAGALFSLGSSIGTFAASMFGDDQLMTKATIDPGGILGLDPDDAARMATVVEGLMVFIMLVGYIAFIRGWLVLKAFADGQSGATLAQGLTFLLGGTLAINLGELINTLQATVDIQGITFS